MGKSVTAKLAVDGGPKVRAKPWPRRGLFGEKEKRAVMALFDRSIATGRDFGYDGEEETGYCEEFSKYLGGGYTDAVNSGTSAIYVALRALEPEPFTEVICPPVTDPGGVMPVPLCNCIPIPADGAPNSYNAGPDQIEARITKRTSAIIVAHIAGYPAEMGPIMEVARAKGIPVIEDCAQAHGAKYKGKFVGTWGEIGAFSTMFGKQHATGGQGGLVFTRNRDLYWKIRRYSDRGKPFGLKGVTSNVVCSLNLNLNDLSACVGRVQLKRLPGMIRTRQRFAEAVTRGCRPLKTIHMTQPPPKGEATWWFLFFRVDLDRISTDMTAFVRAIGAEGIPVGPVHTHYFTDAEWYKNRAVFGSSRYPWASPLYKGDPRKTYSLPNIFTADACHFQLGIHEKCGMREAADVLAAFKKVENAYAI